MTWPPHAIMMLRMDDEYDPLTKKIIGSVMIGLVFFGVFMTWQLLRWVF